LIRDSYYYTPVLHNDRLEDVEKSINSISALIPSHSLNDTFFHVDCNEVEWRHLLLSFFGF